jgi:hypothetical protein
MKIKQDIPAAVAAAATLLLLLPSMFRRVDGTKINIKIKERKGKKKRTSDSRRVASRARAGTLLLLP